MTITISGQVGQGGANKPADVTAVQKGLATLTDDLGLPALAVSGTADAATIAAIIEFQRQVVRLATQDGRIDPGGTTLRTLNAAVDGTLPPARVRYKGNVPAAARIASDYAIRVVEKAVAAAGINAAVITSTIRLPSEQASIMFDKATQDLAAQYVLYGAAGDKVLDVFKANQGKPKAQVVPLMVAKIDELAAQGIRVSLHVVPLDIYKALNVLDIGMGSTAEVAGPAYNVAKITAAFNALQAQGYIRKFIDETNKPNKCWHLEIVPGAKPL